MADYEIYRETDKIGLYVTRSELEVILWSLAVLNQPASKRLFNELEEAALEWDGK